ncbi:MAG: DUF455 family protein [Chlamydiota bacterium]|jgi:uncharacterized ferritin-like protein (DUF455 family)
MELYNWAHQILTSTKLEDKLFSPDKLTDTLAASPLIIKEPARSYEMRFQKRSTSEKLPPFHEHHLEDKRAICLHRFAGHELLAVEIMAYALLAFPQAPKSFRKGIANTLKEEQSHVKIYLTRMQEMGLSLGDLPLYKHFWSHVKFFTDPLKYLSAMSLTFEMANLDFAPHYKSSFERYGDFASAKIFDTIIKDEIKHVSFGYSWLTKLKDKNQSSWDAYTEHLNPLLSPKRSKGFIFQSNLRQKANIPNDWIEKVRQA